MGRTSTASPSMLSTVGGPPEVLVHSTAFRRLRSPPRAGFPTWGRGEERRRRGGGDEEERRGRGGDEERLAHLLPAKEVYAHVLVGPFDGEKEPAHLGVDQVNGHVPGGLPLQHLVAR